MSHSTSGSDSNRITLLMSTSLSEFTTTDIVAWITESVKGGKRKRDAIKIIEDEELTGKELLDLYSTVESLEGLGIATLIARRIMEGLNISFKDDFEKEKQRKLYEEQKKQNEKEKQEKQSQSAKAAKTEERLNERIKKLEEQRRARDMNENNNNNNNNFQDSKKKFAVSIQVGGGKRKLTSKKDFTINSTVLDLKTHIAECEIGGKPEQVRLYCNKKPMKDDQTLGNCGITSSNQWVTSTLRLKGGSNDSDDDEDEKKQYNNNNNNDNNRILDNGKNSDTRNRMPNFQNKNIKATFKPDCLTYDDSEDELRVIMPCGHIFSPLTIFKWCQRTLEVFSKSEVVCPMENCGAIWELKDIVDGADLDKFEKNNLEGILNHRKLMEDNDFKECPSCKALVELPDTVYLCRVRCTNKLCNNARDFCWLCNNPWKGSGMSICGNKECSTSEINEMLKIKNCGVTNEISGFKDVDCPKKRACPRCLTITEYDHACKHMVCWNCKRSFCFICLSLAGKDIGRDESQKGMGHKDIHGTDWACETGNSHLGRCKLAPVQVLT